MMKYIVIVFALVLIGLAIYILVKDIVKKVQGKGCSDCEHCAYHKDCDQKEKK